MMSEKDSWADLADSLGAAPGSEPQPQPKRPAPQPQSRRPEPTSQARPEPAAGDWGRLAADLGLESGREPSTPRAAPVSADERPAREPDEGEGREGRGRRRRGRRGGRGRRGEPRGGEPRAGAGLDETRDHGESRSRSREHDDGRRDEMGGPSLGRAESDARNEDRGVETASPDAGPREPADGEQEDRPRRRRRGRRGGRRRGRSTRERLAGERLSAEQPESEQRLDELDDEPLATAYGALPRVKSTDRPPPSDRQTADRQPAEGDGERRGRRRRRRRGGSESRGAGAARESGTSGGSSSRRGRGSEESRSGSRASRGRRRDDFTPVAGRFDEDDEGLEFLGVEEAGRAGDGGRSQIGRAHV